MDKKLIFKTEYWEIFLSPDQKYLGRGIVLLKREAGHLSDLTQEENADFLTIVKKLEKTFKKTFGATMFNWSCLLNNAYKNDPPAPKVHWHFRPRYKNAVEVGGEIFSDPNFAHHYLRGAENEKIVSKEIFDIIVRKIQEHI